MNAHLSRRTLLGAVPTLAAPMALLPGSIAEAAAETPILSLYRQWAALKDILDNQGQSEEENARLFAVWLDLEERMAAEPATCTQDLAAKMLALSCLPDGSGDSPHDSALEAECEALVAGALR